MNIPYFARLLCLCSAAFFLLHLALVAAVSAFSAPCLRRAKRLRAHAGARLLFAVRMLPATAATLIAAGLCAPSYLRFEPRTLEPERIGLACLAAAAAGFWVCVAGAIRGIRASARSARYVRECEAALESNHPVLLLAGVLRPRLVISRGVREALTADQFAAALQHEQAHGAARDNLKRLLIALAPDPLPFARGLGRIERGWARLAEWAADDRAVSGNRRQSLALAEALVRIARLGGSAPAAGVATPLLGDPADLAARVDRLLQEPGTPPARGPLWPTVVLAASGLAIALHPGTLATVHEALEALAH
jgi:Zn-dependent protease with chaperone function